MGKLDRSDAADARRFRWLLDGNGYFFEEEMVCGHAPVTENEQDKARVLIDLMIGAEDDDAPCRCENPEINDVLVKAHWHKCHFCGRVITEPKREPYDENRGRCTLSLRKP